MAELTEEDFCVLEEQIMNENLSDSSVLLPIAEDMFGEPQLAKQLKEADKILEEFLSKSQMDVNNNNTYFPSIFSSTNLPDRQPEPEPLQKETVEPSPKITRCKHNYADVVPSSVSYASGEFSVLDYVKSLEAKNDYAKASFSDSYYAYSKGGNSYFSVDTTTPYCTVRDSPVVIKKEKLPGYVTASTSKNSYCVAY